MDDHAATTSQTLGKKFLFTTVADVMSASVQTLTSDRPIADAVAIFNEHGFRHMPVVSDNGRLVGIMSDRDALRALAQGKGTAVTVEHVMTRGGIRVAPATSLTDAIDLVVFHRINCLPVTTESGALLGIVTTTDLLQALHELLHERGA